MKHFLWLLTQILVCSTLIFLPGRMYADDVEEVSPDSSVIDRSAATAVPENSESTFDGKGLNFQPSPEMDQTLQPAVESE